MKFKFKFKQMVTLFMAGLFIISYPVSAFASSHKENPLVNIEVSDADGKIIIAQVPQDYAAEYKQKLNNSDFKQEQIDMANADSRIADSRALPDGKLIARKYLYRTDIRNVYDNLKGPGALESLAINVGGTAAIGAVLKAFAVTQWGFISSILGWGIEYARIKPESWWNEALLDIIDKRITCVRMSHIQNTAPTYPAAWLILERI